MEKVNRKGELAMGQIGLFIGVFVVVIVALALIPSIASNTSTLTTLSTSNSYAFTFPSGTPVTLLGQAVTSIVVTNSTGSHETLTAANYTITNYVNSGGVLVSQINNASASLYSGKGVVANITYEPYGYATDSGSRAIVPLIVIFTALAIFGVVVVLVFNKGILDIFRG